MTTQPLAQAKGNQDVVTSRLTNIPKPGKRGALVVPETLANAGGVISTHAENVGYNPKQMLKLVQRKFAGILELCWNTLKRKCGINGCGLNIAKGRIRKARKLLRKPKPQVFQWQRSGSF